VTSLAKFTGTDAGTGSDTVSAVVVAAAASVAKAAKNNMHIKFHHQLKPIKSIRVNVTFPPIPSILTLFCCCLQVTVIPQASQSHI